MSDVAPVKSLISYSLPPTDRSRRTQLLALADRLNADGIDTEIDLYHGAPDEGWNVWMERMAQERTILVACTERYHARLSGEDDSGEGGVEYEARIIRQRLKAGKGVNRDVIPILLDPEERKYIPIILGDVTHYDISTEGGYEALYARLTGREMHEKPPLGTVRELRTSPPEGTTVNAPALNADDAATRAQIAYALERLLDAMQRVFIHGNFPFDVWQRLHNDLDALVSDRAGARALGPRYGDFRRALDHDQFCINYSLGLRAEFDEKAKKFEALGERYQRRETRYHDAHIEQAVAEDVLSLAPFLRDFDQASRADRLEYMATNAREIALRILGEPPGLD